MVCPGKEQSSLELETQKSCRLEGAKGSPFFKMESEMFNLANVRGTMFRESSLFLLGGEELHWKQYHFSATV